MVEWETRMERWEKQEVHKSYGTSILRIFFILPTFYVVFRLLHACNMTSFLCLMLLSTLSTVLVYSQSDCIFTVSDSLDDLLELKLSFNSQPPADVMTRCAVVICD